MNDLNTLTYKIRGCCFNVYNTLGPGLLETVYEKALAYELTEAGLKVECQKDIPIRYKGIVLSQPFKLDILVENEIILELKSVEDLKPVFYKQLMTYLRLSGKKLGFLINFNTDNINKDIHRIIM